MEPSVSAPDTPGRDALIDELSELVHSLETTALPELLEPVARVRLTMQQLRTLQAVAATPGGLALTELSKRFGVSLATMSKIVGRLVEHGMATRHTDDVDQRMRRVRATEQGRGALLRLLARRPEFAPDVLARLSVDDLRALAQGMRALQRARADGSN